MTKFNSTSLSCSHSAGYLPLLNLNNVFSLFPVLKYLFQDHAFSSCNSSMYHIFIMLTYQDYIRSVSSNTSTETFFSYCHLFLTHPGSLPEASPSSLGGASLHTKAPPISHFGCRDTAESREAPGLREWKGQCKWDGSCPWMACATVLQKEFATFKK